ncbi:hypothetical protein Barb6XT_02085 [Bacteroidales bacterium Barb6XT]|nr:hypothetical protein Barb6XT_02085 [Bacteroidales bacterium Barb6XT]
MKKYITGIGISREKPDLCFTQAEKTLGEEETADTATAVRQALKTLLKAACAETSDVLTCAGYTGQYFRPLCCACKDLDIDLRLEESGTNQVRIRHAARQERPFGCPKDCSLRLPFSGQNPSVQSAAGEHNKFAAACRRTGHVCVG